MARDLVLVLLVIAGVFIALGQLFPEASVEELPGKIWEGIQTPGTASTTEEQATSSSTN